MAEPACEQGDVLDGRYRLVVSLGRGGFGDVWRAEELLPDGKPLREVALKLLVRGVAADWAEEARIIASLRHPALVTVYAAGLLPVHGETLPFVAMELLRGENLASIVDAGRKVAWRRALSWAREAAAALDEIHRAGVVHLDLKPANLFLSASGLKVLDFGIAQRGGAREVVTLSSDDAMSTAAFMALDASSSGGSVSLTGMSRTVIGTPGFMAPEVIEGGEAMPAADAYALAACVVQLVTGHLPQDVRARPTREALSEQQKWIAEVQAATLHGRLRDLDQAALGATELGASAGFPRGLAELLLRWLRLDPVARGVAPGSLTAQLDEVWLRPHGATRTPFPGSAPYGPGDEGNLHGRDRERERVARELMDQPCVILHGAAGAGLTSLARAGIVPELAKSGADGRENWVGCHVRLGDDPNRAFGAAIGSWLRALTGSATAEAEPDAHGDAPAVFELDLQPNEALLRLAAWAATAKVGVVVVVEDLGAALDGLIRADEFWPVFAAISDGMPGVRIIGLLREEWLGAFLAHQTGRALQPCVRFVGVPSWSASEELVCDPARALGLRSEGGDEVIADIKAELAREGASLAAVSLALASWWRGPLDAAHWLKQGGLIGPLADHAERSLLALVPEHRAVAEWVLLRLLRADGSAIDVKPDALAAAHEAPELVLDVLDELCAARLVRVRDGNVGIGHPALATRWGRLHDRRLHDVERMVFVEQLRAAASRWGQLGAPPDELWIPAKVAELDGRFRGVWLELGREERAFIEASRAMRRRQLLFRVVAAVAVVAVVFGAVALENVRRARALEQQGALDQATRQAAVERLVTSSRRTADPYRRIALLGAAIDADSRDPLLSFELFAATRELPVANFLVLDPPQNPRFPWDARVVLGHTREHVVLLDLMPDEGVQWGAVETRLAAHEGGLHDVEPLRFGDGFITRGLDGTLRVWRLRENREIALAAESPMRCIRGLSRVLVADAAPVVSCVTLDGLARWDLRDPAHADTLPFGGRLLAISPDGEWLAAARQKRVLAWHRGHEPSEIAMPEQGAAMLAAFSPRDPVLAVVDARVALLFDLTSGTPRPLFAGAPLEHRIDDPVDARFADGGLDLAVCDSDGAGTWTYLRRGGRALTDGPPPNASSPCHVDAHAPAPLASLAAYGPLLLDGASVGPRQFDGGWRLADGRLVTRDLVAFDPVARALTDVTQIKTNEPAKDTTSIIDIVRVNDVVLAQYGDELRAMTLRGESLWSRKARLLSSCADGRVLAWRKGEPPLGWEVIDAARGSLVARVASKPGFVLGVEPSCSRLFVQTLDGRLASVPLTGNAASLIEPTPIDPGGGGYAVDGYVFDARASSGSAETEPGLWLAFSSGAMARAQASGTLRSYGHAAPRATAMADGPKAGELIFADESGVLIRSIGEQDLRLVGPMPGREWSDVRVLPGGERALLAWGDGLALVHLSRRELVGWTELEGRGRVAPWDDEGSMVAWSFAHQGPLRGDLLPLGKTLAGMVAKRASNLVAELDANGAPHVRLR